MTAAFLSLVSLNASMLKEAMRIVGSWAERLGSLVNTLLLLDAVGHTGVDLEIVSVLLRFSAEKVLERKCSPRDEFETNRLEVVSKSEWKVGMVEDCVLEAFGDAEDSAASLVCSCCQTDAVESW